MTTTNNFLAEIGFKKSAIDGVEVVASTSEQCAGLKDFIKSMNCKDIRGMYTLLERHGFAINFSRSLFSDELDRETFNLWMRPFKALQGKLSAYGILKRINASNPSKDNQLNANKAKSACFEELKGIKKWLNVDVHCQSTDIDTLEAHCFKYVRVNRDMIVDGWTVKPVSVLQFINFLFKELNFGKCKDEVALATTLAFSEQGILDADNYAELEKLEQKSDESAESEIIKVEPAKKTAKAEPAEPKAEPAKKPAKKSTKKTASKVAKAEPEATEAEPVKA